MSDDTLSQTGLTCRRTAIAWWLLALVMPLRRVFAAEDLPGNLAIRLSQKWLAKAKRIRTPERVVYYHGTATGQLAPDGRHWAGKIEGEILVLNSRMAVACQKLELGPAGFMGISGSNQANAVEGKPPWQKLLE